MIDAFEGIDRAVGRLAFHRHRAPVVETDDKIGARIAEFAFAAELARSGSRIEQRHVAGRNLGKIDVSKLGLDALLLPGFSVRPA